jgi:hypothetical protein
MKNIAIIISCVFLFLAMIKGWPYGFFKLLRWVVCGTTVYLSLLALENAKIGWWAGFGLIALVFNPLIPLRLDRNLWRVVNLLVAIFLIISIFAFKPEN